jgi:NTP pyrophosphatase (non-canonical NTP hydrolase)
MNNITHAELVAALVKPGEQIKAEVTADELHLLHMLLGICGEAGELLDALKKTIIYRKPLDKENVTEELGDLEFYLEGARSSPLINVKREETLKHNIAKLSKRYESLRYSDDAARERADKQ